MRYPQGIKKQYQNNISHGNRGMVLEHDINDTNQYYLETKKAVIHKKPTPITITKVHYPSRLEAVIKEAYFKTPSTTDYNGVYKNRYIDFEAKETKNDKYFPIANIHIHQINHLKNIIECGGIGFIIVRFTNHNETYLLKGEDLFHFLNTETRKSIPIEYFREKGYRIHEKYAPRLDYLKIVDDLYFKGDSKAWKNL